ncbi:dihydropteroate synthase [Loktanella sp. M215]|uniref:dihydropteroate synthase n=1 Tax=Loktanella sp. M215 TaxID=2675431 RepID=UPI001F00C409|nr:dihydropteroate synthase [Loktanella sp. M215]MCF7700969.1 dihydropteroate synthase [Loktanella sp. M215]
MTLYYRPILQTDPARTAEALTLAGGWCWFDRVEVLARGAASRVIAATDLPDDAALALTARRPAIAGLDMLRPRLMGILNVTPDSFSDGGQFDSPAAAIAQALAMQAQGADIIDVGGESTRPGAETVPDAEEVARTAPIIAALRTQSDVAISIDTRKAAVAEAAVAAGATLINDVSALRWDAGMAQVVADSGQPVCLMHSVGDPATMQQDPRYDDVLLDVYDHLQSRIAAAVAAGIALDRIVVDPGIGFGKTLDHNLALLRRLSLFHSLGCPVLLGASRKRFIGTITDRAVAADRVAGSLAVTLVGIAQGVQIHRVHDTSDTKAACAMALAMNGR